VKALTLAKSRAVGARHLAAEGLDVEAGAAVGGDFPAANAAAAASFLAPGGTGARAMPILVENLDFEVEAGAYFPPDAQLSYAARGGLDIGAGTVMFWVQPVDWSGSDKGSYSFFLLRDPKTLDHHFSVLKHQERLRFQVISEAGVQVLLLWPMNAWRRGEWHHVAATWGDSLLALVVDGALVAEDVLHGLPAVPPEAPAYWGSSRGTNGAGAVLCGARILDRVLAEAEVAAVVGQGPCS
jgi:hypothetical protein